MKTRRQIFDARGKQEPPDVVSTKVTFQIDRQTRRMKALPPDQKMIVALRKVLAAMSAQDGNGCRYYLEGPQVQVVSPVTTTDGRPGDARKFRSVVRCRVGVCHPSGHKSTLTIQATLSFKDVADERGLPDVEFFDPTSVDELPRGTPLNVAGLA